MAKKGSERNLISTDKIYVGRIRMDRRRIGH